MRAEAIEMPTAALDSVLARIIFACSIVDLGKCSSSIAFKKRTSASVALSRGKLTIVCVAVVFACHESRLAGPVVVSIRAACARASYRASARSRQFVLARRSRIRAACVVSCNGHYGIHHAGMSRGSGTRRAADTGELACARSH